MTRQLALHLLDMFISPPSLMVTRRISTLSCQSVPDTLQATAPCIRNKTPVPSIDHNHCPLDSHEISLPCEQPLLQLHAMVPSYTESDACTRSAIIFSSRSGLRGPLALMRARALQETETCARALQQPDYQNKLPPHLH